MHECVRRQTAPAPNVPAQLAREPDARELRSSRMVDRADGASPPPPQWVLWLWWLALVVAWIAMSVAGALLWLVFAPWRILRWLAGHRRPTPPR